ncbi:Flp pilus assembly protein CpaB [Amylibacter sp. IMCC11727]|uniref:Flp pilus assembly protein CpaB n=1 Tax=Amylibacter sp. IMCC11727 TaxID=3039851 RepID=UPI00244E5707|nr:Flp pilus assembly protein CpaB [Amylibacter sp. IMCC11727]WGI22860.1 Flp pilus assembly protein CpaB [Amylibacter sp. IMCC11727]
MRIIFALVLFMGIAIAGGAVYLAMERFNQYETALKNKEVKVEKIDLATVFIANEELPYGTALTKEHVKAVEFPVAAVPENAFDKIEDLIGNIEEGEFRTVIRTMEKGEAILASKVTGIGEDAGVSSRLKKGMRAFAIRVDVASGVSGFLRPGDKVDVYWTGRTDRDTVTKLILNSLELIAIDQQADSSRNQTTIARTVTVAADVKTIGALVQAQSTGKLLLSLRGIDDESTSEQIEITKDDLLGREEIKVVEKEICTIKTRKGAEVIEIPIPCSN